MPERVILTIGTKKGLFVAEAPKTRGRFNLRGPFGPGVMEPASRMEDMQRALLLIGEGAPLGQSHDGAQGSQRAACDMLAGNRDVAAVAFSL